VEEPVVEQCGQCGHPFPPHHMVATREDPQLGGVVVCSMPWCMCFSTWDVPPFSSREDVLIPNDVELAAIREVIQGVGVPNQN